LISRESANDAGTAELPSRVITAGAYQAKQRRTVVRQRSLLANHREPSPHTMQAAIRIALPPQPSDFDASLYK